MLPKSVRFVRRIDDNSSILRDGERSYWLRGVPVEDFQMGTLAVEAVGSWAYDAQKGLWSLNARWYVRAGIPRWKGIKW